MAYIVRPGNRALVALQGAYTLSGTGLDDVLPTINEMASQLISPVKPAIKKIPGLSSSQKNKLENAPFDFLVDTVDPIEDVLYDVSEAIRKRSGKNVRHFLSIEIDMRKTQSRDNDLQPSTRNYVKRMRACLFFFVYWFQEPLMLAEEFAKQAQKFTGLPIADAFKAVENVVKGAAGAVAKGAASVAKSAESTFNQATSAASKFFGMSGLGEPATVAVAAGASSAPATAISTTEVLVAITAIGPIVIKITTTIIDLLFESEKKDKTPKKGKKSGRSSLDEIFSGGNVVTIGLVGVAGLIGVLVVASLIKGK